MNLAELREDVLVKLGEDPSDPKYWSVADVDAAINEAYEEITDATEWNEVMVTLSLDTRRTWYDLNAWREGMLTVLHFYNGTTQQWMRAGGVREFDSIQRDWMSASGEPRRMVRRGLNWLGFFPFSGTLNATIDIYGTAMATPLSADADVPGFPVEFHPGLVHHAVSNLKAQDHEPAQSLEEYEAYLDYEAGLKVHVNSRLEFDKHHILGRP